ncbi:37006_t:CDS:2, partial [Gigaspora margarita]
EIERLRTENIYGLTTKHIIGWLIFSILALTTIYFIRKYTNKLKKKKSENLKEEIRDKFKLWRLNMGFREDITILSVTGILGILFLVDSYISSELKTPLQRLAMKIENAGLDEKEKKELLSKTQ